MTELKEILGKYKYIEKHYAPFLSKFSKINHPLIELLINENNKKEFLKDFDEQLKRLDKLKDLSHLIKESRNPENFWPTVSEIKIMSFLIDNVDDKSIIIPDDPSPDFKIKKSNVEITIEVKKIIDKYECGKVEFLDESKTIFTEENVKTMLSAITESIKRGQYYPSIPHILIFDCSSGIDESEFEDVLYPQKEKVIQAKNNQGNFLDLFGHSAYNGLFYKTNDRGEFPYQMISGIVAFFERGITYFDEDEEKIIVKSPRKIFFENPNASDEVKVPKNIIKSLGFQIHKIF
ncbi:MAG: hypothetical protein PHS47_05525 [Methanocellales archaeon]|nr:hypothetical protein [Methanocellales archaeon]